MLTTVSATRYVTPLREGGSLPAIIEASDDGYYVLKFRSAGQGVRALVAELVAGELARALGFRVPEIVFVELAETLGKAEPDIEIQELVMRSVGLNLALDYLPGSVTYSPAADAPPTPEQAADIVWFDAFVTNPDRMPHNPNMLMWHDELWLIDHGATLFAHHGWANLDTDARQAFPMSARHVLLPAAGSIVDADERLAAQVTPELLTTITSLIPDDWLTSEPAALTAEEERARYVTYLTTRLANRAAFVAAAEEARTSG